MKEGLLSRPPGGPYPGRGGMVMHAPRPLLQPSPMAGGCVLMVYGLHEHKMNCDRVFNVLCCYGNVLKVRKFQNILRLTCIQCNRPGLYSPIGVELQPWSHRLEKLITLIHIFPISTPVQC